MVAAQTEFLFLENLPPPVLSSKPRTWDGIVVEQRHHSPDENELDVPPVPDHSITLHLGQPIELVQARNGHVHQQRVIQGDITLTPAGESSKWCWGGEADVLHLCLQPAFVQKVAAEIDQPNADRIEIVDKFAVRDPHIEHIGQCLLWELQSQGLGSRLYAESLASVLAVHLLRHYSSWGHTVRESIGALSQSKLRRTVEYINDNLAQDLTLPEIAKAVGLSAYHLTRLFKQSTGLAPHQYVIQCRVERAKQLLLRGELTISEVAARVGFFDHSHLNRHFKRLVGVTPRTILHNSKNVLENSTNIQDGDA